MALVAVLSPTDPVAVQNIAAQINLPKKLLSLVTGESLINDASGLIAFKYALAAFITGYFSMTHATLDFLYMSIIGIIIGLVSMIFIHFLKLLLVQQGIQDAGLHTTIQLVTPFLIYIFADKIANASAIIAVVTAGLVSLNQPPVFRSQHSEAYMMTIKMWDALVYILNGLVFLLLGLQLPAAMKETIETQTIQNTTVFSYIIYIWLFLLITRVTWSYLYIWLAHFNSQEKTHPPSFKTALLTGLTGIRGAISMASVMSMPYVLADGQIFSQRSLVVTIACGVILMSLLVATLALPLLTQKKLSLPLVGNQLTQKIKLNTSIALQSKQKLTELEARQLMVKEAIMTLKREAVDAAEPLIISDLIHEFEARLRHLYRENNDDQTNRFYSKLEKEVQDIAIEGEHTAVLNVTNSHKVPQKIARQYTTILKMKRGSFDTGVLSSIKRNLFVLKKQGRLAFWRIKARQQDDTPSLANHALFILEEASTLGAIASLQTYKKQLAAHSKTTELHKHIINQKLHEYLHKLHRLRQSSALSKNNDQKMVQEFYMKAIDCEREVLQELFADGKITLSMLNHLRQSLNYYESSLLQTDEND